MNDLKEEIMEKLANKYPMLLHSEIEKFVDHFIHWTCTWNSKTGSWNPIMFRKLLKIEKELVNSIKG